MDQSHDRRDALIASDAHAGAQMWDYKAYLAREFHERCG
jgi:hypothetical protein